MLSEARDDVKSFDDSIFFRSFFMTGLLRVCEDSHRCQILLSSPNLVSCLSVRWWSQLGEAVNGLQLLGLAFPDAGGQVSACLLMTRSCLY